MKGFKIGLVVICCALAAGVVLATFALQSSDGTYIKLVPAFPFVVLAFWIGLSRASDRPHVYGLKAALLAAVGAVAIPLALYWRDSVTHWRGGADIGLGILYLGLPVYSVLLMVAAYFGVRKRSMRYF